MGFTLHKVMGWGLTDVVTTNGSTWHGLVDPRINAASRLLDCDDLASPVDYLAFLRARAPRIQHGPAGGSVDRSQAAMVDAYLDMSILNDALADLGESSDTLDGRDLDPGNAVVHVREYGDPAVLVLRPVSCTDWHRRGDPLDYATEAVSGHGTDGRVVVMPHAPYPFGGLWMDAQEGVRLPDTVMPWVRLASRLREEPDLSERERGRIGQAMEMIAVESLGFPDGSSAVERIVPAVPGEIRALAEFGDLFTSEDVWRQLRPVLYTYWS